MNWYQPLDQRIVDWRHWRQTLPVEVPEALAEIHRFWYTAPFRKKSLFTDDHASWPSPWALFDTMSYCDIMRGLGMFYSICLHPVLGRLQPEFRIYYEATGDRIPVVLIPSTGQVLNFNPDQIVNLQDISAEYQCASKFVPSDFSFLR